MFSVYYDFVVSWLFYFIICSGKNISRTIMKATSLVQCHFIHKSFLFYNVTWMSCKSCWIFYWPQNRSSCVYLSFFHRALQSSHLSGEEMNGRFFPSASCILFFFVILPLWPSRSTMKLIFKHAYTSGCCGIPELCKSLSTCLKQY